MCRHIHFPGALIALACLAVGLGIVRPAGPPPAGKTLRLGRLGEITTREVQSMVRVSADGRLAATEGAGKGDTVHIWDLTTGKRVARFEDERIPIAFSRDGRAVAFARDDGPQAYDLTSGKPLPRVPPLARGASDCGFDLSPDGRALPDSSESHKGRLHFRDPRTGKLVGRPLEMPAGQRLDNGWWITRGYVTAVSANQAPHTWAVLVWDVTSGQIEATVQGEVGTDLDRLSPSADGRLLAIVRLPNGRDDPSGIPPHSACVREAGGGGAVFRLDKWEAWLWLALSPDGRLLAALGHQTNRIEVWDLALGKVVSRSPALHKGTHFVDFLPDGQKLVSWGPNNISLWDVAAVRRRLPALKPVADADLPTLWADLAGDDAAKARLAVWRLVESPARARPYFAKRLRPVAAPRPARLAELIAALDADKAAARDAAEKELVRLGKLAGPAVHKALAAKPPPEARRRLARMARALTPHAPLSGERLRAWRAVEVLERIGGAPAMHLLRRLSDGAPEAAETRAARAALRRLDDARRAR